MIDVLILMGMHLAAFTFFISAALAFFALDVAGFIYSTLIDNIYIAGWIGFIGFSICWAYTKMTSKKVKPDEKYDYTWFETKKKPSIKVYTEKKHRISQFNGGWRNYR